MMVSEQMRGWVEMGVLDHVTECPFCGLSFGWSQDGGLMLHELPACPDFCADEDPIDFMKRVHQAKENER